ncbi:uncharacterized protein LOC144859389 [Branchiostoma floridae x Branchiostoma japonicum]
MALSKPSSPDPVYTPGTARGAKLAALLVDEGTALVRKIFEHEIQTMNPPSLREQLKKHKRYLTGLRYLNPGQRKTLYPASGDVPDTAQGFDISLLELLLKELCVNAPYSGPRNNLRQYRNNNYGHVSSTDMSEGDFGTLWDELTEILVALGGHRDKILERLNLSIDPEQEVMYFNLLEQMHREDMGFKDLLMSQGVSLRQLRSLVEEVRDNQRTETSSKTQDMCADSAEQMQQATQGPAPDDVIACLKELYTTEYAHVRPLPWCEDLNLHLGEVYTNLQLQGRDDRGQFQDTDTILSFAGIYDTIASEQSQVNNVRSTVRKIRVEGDPGIGKSCSCQKLAFDWSCGKLDRFKIVLFLEMRHFVGKVQDAIFEQLLPKDTKTTPDQLWSYIRENQDDILFILDGLDELSQAAREITDVVDLIQGKILRNCHVLVTSRPYHCVKDLEKCHQFYKIVGYSKENSEEFINKYFRKSPESASKLVRLLQSNSSLSEIVVNPLNNVLICVVWEDNINELPSSKAELYRDIVRSVARRFCTKRALLVEGDKLPHDMEEALRGLGKLSWEGLEQEQLQFNIGEIQKKYAATADNMLNMGLLTRDYSFSRIKRTCYCTFLHKTFQEYMAAHYINGLVIDGSSRKEGMKCVCNLFGMSDATAVNRELVISCCRKYREVQNWLLLILGENSRPLFERFVEELSKAQTDKDRELLSFLCVMWLGTTCAGGKMADILEPCLSQHVTNNLGEFGEHSEHNSALAELGELARGDQDRLSRPITNDQGELRVYRDDHPNWCVGLAHVLGFQKNLSVSHGARFIQHLTIYCRMVDGTQQEKLDVLESTLSDYHAMRSVTLLEIHFSSINFSPIRTFIPRCGTERVVIRNKHRAITNLALLHTFEQLSAVSTIEHIEITTFTVTGFDGNHVVEFSEYDRQLACMIKSHSRLRSFKLEIGSWLQNNPNTRGFGNLTATLQSISEHSRLEVVEFELPGDDSLLDDTEYENEEDPFWQQVGDTVIHTLKYTKNETFNVEPMVYKLAECVKKNKVLKTLKLRWGLYDGFSGPFIREMFKIYHGDCSSQALSSLCSAIRKNRTLETLEVEGMLSLSERKAKMISKLERNKPRNYKELSITSMVPYLPSIFEVQQRDT